MEALCPHKGISGMNEQLKEFWELVISFCNYSSGNLFCLNLISIVHARSFLVILTLTFKSFALYLKKKYTYMYRYVVFNINTVNF